jgi:hypothetical protein
MTYARQILFVTLIQELEMGSSQDLSRMMLELFGNVSIRKKTFDFVRKKSAEFVQIVASLAAKVGSIILAVFAAICFLMYLREREVSYSVCKQKRTSFKGQARCSKMMSPGGKLTAPVCHQNKKVNKAEELTYLSLNIGVLPILLICPPSCHLAIQPVRQPTPQIMEQYIFL